MSEMGSTQNAESAYTVPVGPAWNGVTRAWVTKTLAEHRFTLARCSCGWSGPANAPALPAHELHVAEVLVAEEPS